MGSECANTANKTMVCFALSEGGENINPGPAEPGYALHMQRICTVFIKYVNLYQQSVSSSQAEKSWTGPMLLFFMDFSTLL